MYRYIFAVLMPFSLIVLTSGCDALVGWGELGDEVSAGPYRFRPPKRFKLEKNALSVPGETKVMYRGPASGKSEPGILISYAPHHLDLSQIEPDWDEAARMGMMPLRMKCTNFTYDTGSLTSLNGLPAMRISFNGDFTHKSETREMHGIGFLVLDNSNLLFAVGMDFGPKGAENVARLETSLSTISRPGFSASFPWMNGGGSLPGTGQMASSSGYPGNGASSYPGSAPGAGPPGYPGSLPGTGSAGYPGSRPGSSPPTYPGSLPGSGVSGYPGSAPGAGHPSGASGYPGSRPGPGMPGYPGSTPGSRYPGGRSGYPGSRPGPGMPGYPGGQPGSGMAGYPGGSPAGYPGRTAGYPGSSGPSAGSGSGPSTPPPPVDPEVARRQAEEAKEKAERMSIARNPSNPEYFRCNLEMLQGGDESEQRHAVAEMAKADPEKVSDAELRKEIARAIRDIAMSEGIPVWTRKEAVPALVVWGSSYSVPILIDLLNTSNTSVKGEAIKQLTKLNDERAIEAVVMAFVQEASLRDEAAAFLRRFGSAAEDPVLKLARPTDFVVTRATVQLLGDIGTRKSLEPLRSLRKLNFYRLVEEDVRLAVNKIRLRMAQKGGDEEMTKSD